MSEVIESKVHFTESCLEYIKELEDLLLRFESFAQIEAVDIGAYVQEGGKLSPVGNEWMAKINDLNVMIDTIHKRRKEATKVKQNDQ